MLSQGTGISLFSFYTLEAVTLKETKALSMFFWPLGSRSRAVSSRSPAQLTQSMPLQYAYDFLLYLKGVISPMCELEWDLIEFAWYTLIPDKG